MAKKRYDFSGYVTRNDLLCSDGRTIRQDAFKDQDGEEVSLVWGHNHDTPKMVLGKVLLENRKDGVYGYASFNDSEEAQHAKEAVRHGDIKFLSIYANRLKQKAGNVMHGMIREVSLVYGGANPGAFIDNAVLQHSDGTYETIDDEAEMCFFEQIELAHADDDKGDTEMKDEEKKPEDKKSDGDRTVQDVIDSMTDEQRLVLNYLVDKASEESEGDDDDEDEKDDDTAKHSDMDEGEEDMKYNAFENKTQKSGVICHADQEDILQMAKDNRVGTFQNAFRIYCDENELQHDDEVAVVENRAANVGGFVDTQNPLDTSFTSILPEYKDVRPGAPELITSDQGWISVVLNKVHKSPISRVRTGQVDIRNIEALRAKGYKKGNMKALTGNIKLARRTTDPQTIYVKNALNRDDIIDITDFDYVQYLYNIDRMMLNEELATAIMLGDGREDGDPDKIDPAHIRPIWTDDELYTLHVNLDYDAAKTKLQGTNTSGYFGENYIYAEAMIETLLYARENFKGTGTPDLFITPHMLNVMMLARDMNGRRIYSSKTELASALDVGSVITAEQFANRTRTDGNGNQHKLLGIVCNLADYSLGSTKGGQVTHFTQFDIDFNQEKSLLETRVSGALTRVYSAIAIEEPVAASPSTPGTT